MSALNDTTVQGRVTQTLDATDDQHLLPLKQATTLLNANFQGVWDDATTYKAGQTVRDEGFFYSGTGQTLGAGFYIANIENTNKQPATHSTVEWRPAALDGQSSFTYIRYATDSSGTGFSTSPSGKTYVAFLTTTTAIASPAAGDFAGMWVKFVSDASTVNTDAVTEGSTNLYFTAARVRANTLTGLSATTGAITATDTVLSAFNKTQGRLAAIEAWSTTNLSEGSNLYYTDARARAAITATAPITISSGVIACNAASANTASYLVQRDSNGDFAARKITLGTAAATDHLTLGTACTLGYTSSSALTTNVPFKATKYLLSTTHDLRTSGGEMALYSLTESANIFSTLTGKLVVTALRLTGLSGLLKADGSGDVTGSSTSDDLTEGSTNLYFTNARADTRSDLRIAAVAGAASGLAQLDSGSKLTSAQIPTSLVGALVRKGTWNANTNSPSLASSTGTQGNYYVVSANGTTNLDGITDWKIGDWAVYSGSAWEKVDNSDLVASVNGAVGTVVLTTSDIAEGSNLYHTDARTRNCTLTGFSSTTGTISASDTVLSGFNKCQGRLAAIEAWTTDTLTEGSTNLYHTDARVRACTLSGFSATTGAISSSDTVLSAFNKTQGRLAAIEGQTRYTNLAQITASDGGGETSLLDGSAPSITANTLSAGNVIQFEAWGTSGAGTTGVFRLKVGAALLTVTVSTMSDKWHLRGSITIRSTGSSGAVYGSVEISQPEETAGTGGENYLALAGSTRNTTSGLTLDLTCDATGGDVNCEQLRIRID